MVKLMAGDIEVREIVHLLFDLFLPAEEILPCGLEIFGALKERFPLGLKLLDGAQQIADGVVARDLGAEHRVLALDLREALPQLMVLIDERLGELDTALKKGANKGFSLFSEIDWKIACSSHAL